jgi:hypothetical protein
MSRRFAILLIFFMLLCLPVLAQETGTASDVAPGTLIEGRIDDRDSRAIYFFDGSRGEVIRFRLTTTGGNLDATLTVFDDTGEIVFSRDDMRGSLDVDTTITIQRTARHYVVVGRFGYSLGSTSGTFELALERVGVVSDQGTNLLYGVPVLNSISGTQPQVYYTFQAQAGDIVDVQMSRSSGTLDPYLQVVDSNRFMIAENDDAPDGGTRNARIPNLVIRQSGTYIIIATRYGQASGESVGTFVLKVETAENSGLGNSSIVPVPILANEPVEDTLDDDQYQRFYSLTAERDDIITVTMNQTGGTLDAMLIIANAGLQPLIQDDDSGSGSNARIESFRIPADGEYYIVAGRADGITGTSAGGYRLEYQRGGIAFEGVHPDIPRLEYGATFTDLISNEDPDSIFAFWGSRGDVITVGMNRADGDLDPVLELLNTEQNRLVSDDDGGGGQNARITRYALPYSGVYYVRAARYSGSTGSTVTTGGFNLTLMRTAP